MPRPRMVGATNPVGPHWRIYKQVFADNVPAGDHPGMKKDRNGVWWVRDGDGWRLIRDPLDYHHLRSTLLDNPYLMRKDPTTPKQSSPIITISASAFRTDAVTCLR
jgi:hypothetical protein